MNKLFEHYSTSKKPGCEYSWSEDSERKEWRTRIADLSNKLKSVGLQANVKFVWKGPNKWQVIIEITKMSELPKPNFSGDRGISLDETPKVFEQDQRA